MANEREQPTAYARLKVIELRKKILFSTSKKMISVREALRHFTCSIGDAQVWSEKNDTSRFLRARRHHSIIGGRLAEGV